MKIIKILLTSLLAFTLISTANAQQTIRVAVAANLALPMQPIKQAFEKQHPGVKIEIISASSGKLTAQIKNKAPFHIFISANMFYPENLHQDGITKNTPQVITYGRLVFWSKSTVNENNINVFLNESDTKTIAIAQPELAPYGANAKNWLMQHNNWKNVQSKIVYGESIGKVNQYIFSGSVNAAFTAASAMYSKQLKDKGHWQVIKDWQGIPHGGMVLNYGLEHEAKASSDFFKFLFSQEAQKVFEKFGYDATEN